MSWLSDPGFGPRRAHPIKPLPCPDRGGEAMTTLTAPPQTFAPAARLFTAADLAALPWELPSGPINWELHHGRLVLMPPVASAGHENV